MVIPFVASDIRERDRMVKALRRALKRHEMTEKACIAVSADNYLVLQIIVDSSVSETQIKLIRQMKRMIHLHLSEEEYENTTSFYWTENEENYEEDIVLE